MTDARASHDPRWHTDGRLHFGVGIEDTFVPQERVGARKLDEYELTQHYQYWRSDLQLAAESGAELIRWGIPWYLVEPVPGRFDFTWIDEVAATLSELGLRCVVDLMHYGTPLWLENQFLNPGYVDAVTRYSGEVAARYRGTFLDYTPLNEPLVNAIWCGRDGRWPPYLSGHRGLVAIALQLTRGIQSATRAIRAAEPDATIVHVDAGFRWVGEHFPDLSRDELHEWRFLVTDLMTGRLGREHPMWDYLRTHGATEPELDALAAAPVHPDVMGVNYYPDFTTSRFDPETGRELPVVSRDEGLTDILRAYADRYGTPLAITETSSARDAAAKIEWLQESLRTVDRLRSEGMQVAGYFWFPFLDLIDWSYRDGTAPMDDYRKSFGLVDLRRGADNVWHRVPNPAFTRFQAATGGPR